MSFLLLANTISTIQMNDSEENKSAYNTCIPFNPNDVGMLVYDKERHQCILGGERGLELKDKADPVCNVKYNVKIVMDADESSTLILYFSNDGGESFYNSDNPSVTIKDVDERRRLESECSTNSKHYLSIRSQNIIRTTIPPRLFGTNLVYSWEPDNFWNGDNGDTELGIPPGDTSARLSYMGGAYFRYPGGEVTSYYHFDKPTGRGWTDSWAPNFDKVYEPQENWMSLDEYFQNLGNRVPLLGINMASGWKYNNDTEGLEEAEALAKYVRNKIDNSGWPEVTYFFLDNEQYMESFCKWKNPDKYPQCTDALKNGWTERLYGYYINQYAPRIRIHFPNAKFVANWKHLSSSWTRLISEAPSNIDVMDVHSYWSRYGWGTTDWSSYLEGTNDDIQAPHCSKRGDNNLCTKSVSYRQWIQDLKSAGGSNREVALLEWGISPSTSSASGKAPSRLQMANIMADILMQLINSELDAACYWPLRVDDPNSEFLNRTLFDMDNKQTVIWNYLQFFKEIKGYDLLETSIGATKAGVLAAKNKAGTKIIVYILRRGEGSLNIIIKDLDESFSPSSAKVVSYYALNEDTYVDDSVWSAPSTTITATARLV